MPLFSQQYLSLCEDTTANTQIGTPRRSVKYEGNSIVVTYGFNDAIVTEDPLFENCNLLRYNGFGLIDISGKPSLPVRKDAFSLTQYSSIEIIDTSYVEIPMELGPARPPLMDSDNTTYTQQNTDTITPYQGFYPANILSIDDIQYYRRKGLLWVSICPLQYDYEHKIVRAYTKIKYRININNDGESPNTRALSNHNYTLIDNIVLNKSKYPQNIVTDYIEDNQDYLILSTNAYKTICETFANWKRTQGYRTHIVLKDNWTSSQVRNVIQNLYITLGVNLKYVLIIGDENAVPPIYKTINNKSYPTDLYYGCMDGENDVLPDIFRGRIPNTKSLAHIPINKIISYEKNPCQDSLFYKTGLNCAFFEDELKDGYADRRFAQTSEDIKNYVELQGKVVDRVYFAEPDVTPTNWNQGTFSSGEAIPSYLRKPNFAWDGNGTDIYNKINEGTFYVFYRGHGEVDYWDSPNYSINNFSSEVNNSNKTPIIFSITCLTGRYNTIQKSLAELFLEKGVCAGIIAATIESCSGYNEGFSFGMFNTIWPEPGLMVQFPNFDNSTYITLESTPVYEMGQIFDQGILAMKSTYGQQEYAKYTHEIFHYFGDPSMQIYTETPKPIEEPEIIRIDNKIYVHMPDGDARVSFYNPITKKVDAFLGNNIEYTTTTDSISICISRHNYIPYITTTVDKVYIQNEVISQDRQYNATSLEVGKNVTDKKATGNVIFEGGTIYINSKNTIFAPGTIIRTGAKLNVTTP